LGRTAAANPTAATVASLFPFHAYFANAPQPLFPETATLEEAKRIAEGCYKGHLANMFQQLEEMRGTPRPPPRMAGGRQAPLTPGHFTSVVPLAMQPLSWCGTATTVATFCSPRRPRSLR